MRTTTAPALVALLLAAGLGACGDPEPTSGEPSGPTTSASPTDPPSAPDPTPTEEPSESGSPTGEPETVTVPVYFVGDTPQGPALYREFRRVEADNPLEEAAALLTSGDALDPDYRTLFPGGTFASVTYVDGELRAVLPDDGWTTPVDQTRREARLAVQSLVYTLQGVQQERAPLKVFVGESSEPGPLFGVDTTDGVRAAAQWKVLAHMSVTSPEQDASVSGTVTASGTANSFEATVVWEVREGGADGPVVLDGFTTAEGWGERNYPWEAEVDVSGLAPGVYTFVARTDDPSGGEGGGPHQDTKSIVVE